MTHRKLLVWALPDLRRAVFLDLDLLVLRNVDGLTFEAADLEGDAAFSAVAALPYSRSLFNSGVFVFAPSLPTAAALHDLSRRATFERPRARGGAPSAGRAQVGAPASADRVRVLPALEKFHLTDQSILNHYFRGRWRPLPFGYNVGVKIRSVNRALWGQIEHVVHVVRRRGVGVLGGHPHLCNWGWN